MNNKERLELLSHVYAAVGSINIPMKEAREATEKLMRPLEILMQDAIDQVNEEIEEHRVPIEGTASGVPLSLRARKVNKDKSTQKEAI